MTTKPFFLRAEHCMGKVREAPASALSKVCSCCARYSQYMFDGSAKNGGLDTWLGATGDGNRQGGVITHAGSYVGVRTCASSAMVLNESKYDGGEEAGDIRWAGEK
jgi:hypothetical protein